MRNYSLAKHIEAHNNENDFYIYHSGIFTANNLTLEWMNKNWTPSQKYDNGKNDFQILKDNFSVANLELENRFVKDNSVLFYKRRFFRINTTTGQIIESLDNFYGDNSYFVLITNKGILWISYKDALERKESCLNPYPRPGVEWDKEAYKINISHFQSGIQSLIESIKCRI